MGSVGFTWIDYTICSLFLFIFAFIGLYYRFSNKRLRSKTDYILAGRDASILSVAFSLLSSFMSAITILSVVSENYYHGTQFLLINLSYGLATPFAAYFFLPTFFSLREFSVYQYLEHRFGKLTRYIASISYIIMMILYTGIVLYAPALALNAVSGLSMWISVLLVGAVCICYSSLGGMKAVLINDSIQTLLMFSLIISVLAVGIPRVGSFSDVLQINYKYNRFQFFNFSLDLTQRCTFWTQVVGGFFIYLSLYAVNQTQVQRLMSLHSLARAQLCLWLQWPVLSLLSALTSLAGLVLFAVYHLCDPLSAGYIAKPDQLLPYFMLESMRKYPGLPGIFFIGIFSGSLSTVSSVINSMSTVIMEDFVKALHLTRLYDNAMFCLPALSVLCGVLCMGVSWLATKSSGSLLSLSLSMLGIVGGPLLGAFTLGMFTTRTNQPALLIGLCFSYCILFIQLLSTPKFAPQYLILSTDACIGDTNMTNLYISDVRNNMSWSAYFSNWSYMWQSVSGFTVTCMVAYFCSFCFTAPHFSPTLLSPLCSRWNEHGKSATHKVNKCADPIGSNSLKLESIMETN